MRRYDVTLNAQAVSAAKDLLCITAPSTMALYVMRAWISQSGNNTSEQARAILQRASDSQNGTAVTPEKLEVGDPAASFTATSLPGTDHTLTGIPFVDEGFNWVSGFLWVPAPEERIIVPPSGKLVLRLPAAPSAAKTVSAGLSVMEIG